jgi:hypothetical protein
LGFRVQGLDPKTHQNLLPDPKTLFPNPKTLSPEPQPLSLTNPKTLSQTLKPYPQTVKLCLQTLKPYPKTLQPYSQTLFVKIAGLMCLLNATRVCVWFRLQGLGGLGFRVQGFTPQAPKPSPLKPFPKPQNPLPKPQPLSLQTLKPSSKP